MRTGTVGSGTVGQALAEYLGGQHQILISDPGYPEHADPLPVDLDALIVCVVTPGVSHIVVTPDRGVGGACFAQGSAGSVVLCRCAECSAACVAQCGTV